MSDVKDFFHILFFLVMGSIAIFSYIQARKTLFSPIRTEIFKIQIEEIKQVLVFFNKQNSMDFDREYGINEIFDLNSFRMHQAYVSLFFEGELKPSEEALNHFKELSYGAVVSAEHLEEITIGSELESKEQEKKELSPAMKLAKWQEYKMHGVEYTRKFNEKQGDLMKLAASPLLPKVLTDLLYEFHSLIGSNLIQIGATITECAQELPKKYVTAEDNRKFRPDWIWNKYNSDRKNPEEVSEKILRFINTHYKINEIMQ
ncbi:MAG: hypothetical protein N0E54_04215 [Candidatus Thiodiazotropha taylori]|nr:hypothetical protein [Candidatus Thiodiazotropha endolucinida]MCW4227934.1 hypothetical protein [Candidatus Thiodiazotropha taylori]